MELTSIFFLFMVSASASTTVVQCQKKNIFILSGQSNMVGRGSPYQLITEREPNTRILRFSANRTWEEAADPLHADIDIAPNKTKGVGPGMPFSKSILKKVPDFGLIGLVPCAIGATSISQWSKGAPYPYYNSMVERAQAALAAGGGEIRALLWYQGEAETGDSATASAYKMKLQKFINDVRTDLQLPLLPVIEVALDFVGNGSYPVELVRKAQFEIAVELPNMRCVDAKGLEISLDNVHLTTAAQIQLGAKMADSFLDLIGKK